MDFSEQLRRYVIRANVALHHFIKMQPFQNTLMVQAMKHGSLLGGKRLRPFLVYSTGNMFGVDNKTLDVPAAVLECIHSYSLIHDDLPAIDNHDLRRSLQTCHIKYGEAHAILAGDALQTLAFSILSDAPMKGVSDHDRLAMISELAMASGVSGMCGGQALDLETEGKQITQEEIERIYRLKTGSLIRAAIRLGVLSAGKRSFQAIIKPLDLYAKYIGIAFQIQDDILDVIGNTKRIGKNRGSDQRLGKNTYITLFGLRKAQNKARDLIKHAQKSLEQLSAQSLNISALEKLAEYIIQRDK